MAEDDGFEVIAPTEIDAADTPASTKVRKLCACGCGEEVSGNRALKRGHSMGEGLSPSIFGGNDILVFQAGFVFFLASLSQSVENWSNKRFLHLEPEEATAIGEPLARITARHLPKALLKRMKPGDLADGGAVLMTAGAYALRNSSQKRTETIASATNGYVSDTPVSGLNQYAYRPPEQTFQQENGGTN